MEDFPAMRPMPPHHPATILCSLRIRTAVNAVQSSQFNGR
jgi:hypothetical protein